MNVYYKPHKFDLELVCDFDYEAEFMHFDKRCIWRHTESGKLYTKSDMGDDWAVPFDFVESLQDLDEYGDGQEVIEEIKKSGDEEADYFLKELEELNV